MYLNYDEFKDFVQEEISEVSFISSLPYAQKFIEIVCGNIFEEKVLTLELNGTGSYFLPVPLSIIEITSLKFRDSDDSITNYSRNEFIVNKGNDPMFGLTPSIKLRNRNCYFPEGDQNIVIQGKFGLVEQQTIDNITSNVTPILIKKAISQMILDNTSKIDDSNSLINKKMRYAVSETTDGHSYSIGNNGVGVSDFPTGIKEVDDILNLYSKQISISVI